MKMPNVRCALVGTLVSVWVPLAGAGDTPGDSVSVSGFRLGTVYVNATGRANTQPVGTGGFKAIIVQSGDTLGRPAVDRDSIPGPMPYVPAALYATRQTVATGVQFSAQSKASVIVNTLTPTQVTWTVTPANFGIAKVGPWVPGAREVASALWIATDPMSYTGLTPGDLLSVRFTPDPQGWDMFLFNPSATSFSSAVISGNAKSDVAGYERLFDWSLGVHGDRPGQVDIAFTSNPLLGLNDGAIRSDISSRFSYDAVGNDYHFNADGFSLSASFAVPNGVSAASLTTELSSELMAVAVPEPSAGALFGLGALAVLALYRRRARAA